MDKELKFKKLSEVEKIDKPSKNACALIEEDGVIKRAAGGIGGGDFVFDITQQLKNCEIYFTENEFPELGEEPMILAFSEASMCAVIPLTKDEYKLLKEKAKSGTLNIRGQADAFFEIPAEFYINEKFSTQFCHIKADPDFGTTERELGILTPCGSGVFGLMLESGDIGNFGPAILTMFGFLSGNEEAGGILSVPFSPISLLFTISD